MATVPAPQAAEPGEASRWRAAFRVVSADGHPVAGETSFTVLPADIPDGQQTSPTPTPQGSDTDTTRSAPEPDEDQGGVPWLLIAIPGAVLGLILLVVVAAMRLLGGDEQQ